MLIWMILGMGFGLAFSGTLLTFGYYYRVIDEDGFFVSWSINWWMIVLGLSILVGTMFGTA